MASLDILLSTFISNAIVLFSLLADRGYKKTKYKYTDNPNAPGASNGFLGLGGGEGRDRKGSVVDRVRERWGSDEDLITGKGGETIGLKELNVGGNGGSLKGKGGVKRPEEVKLGDIRVNSTWEITVDDK